MKRINVNPKKGFHVVAKTKQSEAATMVIEPGDKEGGPDNKHPADQWLFVLAGEGSATVDGKEVELSEGTLLEIAAGETHEIRCEGDAPLRTINFYSAPVY